jgi:hypothetical protein
LAAIPLQDIAEGAMQEQTDSTGKDDIGEILRRRISEDEARWKSEFFGQCRPRLQIIRFIAILFEISAHWKLRTVLSYDGADDFEAYLRDELLASTTQAASWMMESWPEREGNLSAIRTGLLVRIEHWKAEALKCAREAQNAARALNRARPSGTTNIEVDHGGQGAMTVAPPSPAPASEGQATLSHVSASHDLGAAPISVSGRQADHWGAVEITFISEFKVQIKTPTRNYSQNYGELGFADRRARGGKHKPTAAWSIFRALAESGGVIQSPKDAGEAWTQVEKRMQELRRALRNHFVIAEDPIPFIHGVGYQARFKASCAPSYDA